MKPKYIMWRIRDKYYYPIRQFVNNIWKFRKELSNFYDWNYDLGLFRKTIELNKLAIEKYAHEVPESRLKKLAKMERVIYLLKLFEEDYFLGLAEEELGYKYDSGDWIFEPIEDKPGFSRLLDGLSDEVKEKNTILHNKSIEIKDALWVELWSIIQGQYYKSFNKEVDFYEQFDGSGILTWWD